MSSSRSSLAFRSPAHGACRTELARRVGSTAWSEHYHQLSPSSLPARALPARAGRPTRLWKVELLGQLFERLCFQLWIGDSIHPGVRAVGVFSRHGTREDSHGLVRVRPGFQPAEPAAGIHLVRVAPSFARLWSRARPVPLPGVGRSPIRWRHAGRTASNFLRQRGWSPGSPLRAVPASRSTVRLAPRHPAPWRWRIDSLRIARTASSTAARWSQAASFTSGRASAPALRARTANTFCATSSASSRHLFTARRGGNLTYILKKLSQIQGGA